MEVKLFWVQSPAGRQSFKGRGTGSHTAEFEQQMNAWLADNPDADIAHVEQSACGGSWAPALWLISVWFTRKSGV